MKRKEKKRNACKIWPTRGRVWRYLCCRLLSLESKKLLIRHHHAPVKSTTIVPAAFAINMIGSILPNPAANHCCQLWHHPLIVYYKMCEMKVLTILTLNWIIFLKSVPTFFFLCIFTLRVRMKLKQYWTRSQYCLRLHPVLLLARSLIIATCDRILWRSFLWII